MASRNTRRCRERQYFDDWFDQIREVQGTTILARRRVGSWRSPMANVENPVTNLFIPAAMEPLAEEGNEAIFDDVFPRAGKGLSATA